MTTATSKRRILLVEDDPALGFVIQDILQTEGYTVHLARNGAEGLQQFYANKYDLCILDVMLPKKDGFSLAEDIRKIDTATPLVFLTAKALVEDKVKGFRAGADDYICKPFSNEEFLLRLEAVMKRYGKTPESPSGAFRIGKYTFDPEEYQLQTENFTKTLTRKEAGILKLLCENFNSVVERDLITNLVWGDDNYFVGRSLDVFITKLRKYLSQDPTISIKNIHGVGFKLETTS